MLKILTAASLAAAIALTSSAHAAEYVTDGNFDTLTHGLGQLGYNTDAPTWTVNPGLFNSYEFVMNQADIGSSGEYGGLTIWDKANGGTSMWNGQSPNGDNFVALDGDFQDSPLSQTITGLTPGKSYQLTFSYAFSQQNGFSGDTIQNMVESFGSQTYTTPTYNLPSHGFSGWTTYTQTVQADSTSDVLSFLAVGDLPVPPFALLSDVSLTGSVPESATWAMMIVGLGAIGIAARRRRQVITAV